MATTSKIVAAAWNAWAAWQSEKEDRSGGGHPLTWAAIMELFRIMDGA